MARQSTHKAASQYSRRNPIKSPNSTLRSKLRTNNPRFFGANNHRSFREEPRSRYPFADEDEGDDGAHDDSDLFEWDEEKTLVEALMNNGTYDDSERDKLAQLAYKLKNPFSARSHHFREYIAEVLVPMANRVKETCAFLDDKIDMTFGAGIMAFDDACQKMELLTITVEDSLGSAYNDHRKTIEDLFVQIDSACKHREQLRTDFLESTNQSAELALKTLKDIPLKIEQKISALERQSKEMDKENIDTAKAREKMFKELFGK